MRRIIGNVVQQLGISKQDFDEAEDGVVAWKLFQEKNDYDVVLTDWNMPNMNGLDLVKHIRTVNKTVPIVMITTEGGKGEVITALKAGVNNYIVKPFSAEILKTKLEPILNKYKK
jgi:two-component system chemotaxis response regulator CheY